MPFLLKIEWNGRHQLELRSLPWKFCSSIWARMELEFMSNPFTKSDVLPARLTIFCSIPTYILCRIHIVRTQRTISEITFQMWDISIPDAQEDQLQVVQTHNIGMRASFAGIVCLYEDPIAHVLLCICTVSNSSIFIIRLVLQMLKSKI